MIPIQITYVLTFVFYLASILIHILVLSKRINYTLVNGGRSESFAKQQRQSQASIIILFILFLFVLSTIIFPDFRSTMIYVIIMSLLVLFWLAGTIMQLLGTEFEKKVVFVVNLVGLLSHILLLLDYFQ